MQLSRWNSSFEIVWNSRGSFKVIDSSDRDCPPVVPLLRLIATVESNAELDFISMKSFGFMCAGGVTSCAGQLSLVLFVGGKANDYEL